MSVLAWHFVGETLRDGRPVPLDGEWLVHEGRAVMCVSGLHASLDAFDALAYAPGSVLCRVECDGVVETGTDKLVCRRRRIIQRRDVTDMLRRFAREQALSVIHLWDAPEVVVTYLRTGDEATRDAAGAAALAALDAAWSALDAAWAADAARDAALAALDAAWSARDAAGAAALAAWAARDAAGAAALAAGAAAGDARDAAWDADAARDAARTSARAAARHRFNEMVKGEFGQ